MSRAELEISGLLDRAYHFTYGDGANAAVGQALATEAIGRGLLALIPIVREIGDQLDTLPRAATPEPADERWIVRAEWVNSSPTYHGPHQYAEQATAWAREHLGPDDACTQWDIGVLS